MTVRPREATGGPPRDPVGTLVGFARTLRAAGVSATPDRVHAWLGALGHLDVRNPRDVYHSGRLTLCSGPDDLVRYDRCFAAYFSGFTPPPPRPAPPPVRMPRLVSVPDVVEGDPSGGEHRPAAASPAEVLRFRDVSRLREAERAEVRRLITLLDTDPPQRRSRRLRPAPQGRLDPYRTIREMLRRGGEPSRLLRRRPRRRPRRTVLIVDVSGSMAPYADALLRFAHAVVRARPRHAEAFSTGTRLTRLTRELRIRDADGAMTAAAAAIPDWSGGTRLGEELKEFLDMWGQRGMARGAIVVICSDGWERGDATLLGEQMRRLSRLAHSVVWANPHKAQPGYRPLTAGMRAALPYVDAFVAGHSLAALEELARVIGGDRRA
ncbi:MAG: VWA domain-containing protein [Streptosporangiales bacterium]|nr:VWA domain-containing protein [Streptosporangiales bacterium]